MLLEELRLALDATGSRWEVVARRRRQHRRERRMDACRRHAAIPASCRSSSSATSARAERWRPGFPRARGDRGDARRRPAERSRRPAAAAGGARERRRGLGRAAGASGRLGAAGFVAHRQRARGAPCWAIRSPTSGARSRPTAARRWRGCRCSSAPTASCPRSASSAARALPRSRSPTDRGATASRSTGSRTGSGAASTTWSGVRWLKSRLLRYRIREVTR